MTRPAAADSSFELSVSCRHRYAGGFEVDVDFTCAEPTTALFGPSGSGKTSILMMVAGFLTPMAGRIVCNGRVLLDTDAGVLERPEQRRLGVVFQDQRLFPHLTVEANLRFGHRRRARPADAPAFERTIDVLELSELLARSTDGLSGGERQRVALARALLSAPELLLLDEPVAAVDEPRRDTILRYVERVAHEWSVPMLYVSHHRAEVQRLADRVVALDEGRVIEHGPPDRVLGADTVVGAHAPVNLLRVEHLVDDEGGWVGALPGSSARLRVPRSAGASEPAFVEFAASDVMLASGSTEGLSARNRLPATVVDLVPRAGRVFVAVRVGEQQLWAEVTESAVHELDLRRDQQVTCLIKSAALRVVS